MFPSVDISFLVQYLLSIAAQLELRSSAAIRLLSDFISPPDKAVHFAHEVEMFARSPFKSLEGYDTFCQYGRPEKESKMDADGVGAIRVVAEPRTSGRERRLSGGQGGRVAQGQRGVQPTGGRRMSTGRYEDGPRGGPLPRGAKRWQPEPDWRERDSFVPPPQSARHRRRSEREGDRYAPRPESDRRRSDPYDNNRRDDRYGDERFHDGQGRRHGGDGQKEGDRARSRSRSRSIGFGDDGYGSKSRDLPPHRRHSPHRQDANEQDRMRTRSFTPVARRSPGSPVLANQPFDGSSSVPARPTLSIFGRATQSIRPQSQPQLAAEATTAVTEEPTLLPSTSAPTVPTAAPAAGAADKRALLQARLLAEYRTSLTAVRTAPAPAQVPPTSTSLRDRLRMRLELEKLEQSRAALVRAKAARIDWERANGIAPGAGAASPTLAASPILAGTGEWADWSSQGIDWSAAAAQAGRVEYTQDLKDMLLARLEEEKRLAGVTAEAPAFVKVGEEQEQARAAEARAEAEGAMKEEKLRAALKRRLAAAREMREGRREVVEARGRREKEEEMARRAGELRERLVQARKGREGTKVVEAVAVEE